MKKTLILLGLVVTLIAAAAGTLRNYSYIFAKNIQGEIVGLDRLPQTDHLTDSPHPITQLPYLFTIAIRQSNGEIVVASSEDRQWAVAQKGICVEAKFFPYAPWNLERSGTYFGAHLIKLYDCSNVESK